MIFNFLKNNPSSIAFILSDGQELSYAQLNEELKAMIEFFQAQHWPEGERIIFLLPQDINLILAYYACLYLGLIAVPVFAETTAEEILKVKKITGAAWVVSQTDLCEHFISCMDITNQLNFLNIQDKPKVPKNTATLIAPHWPEDTKAILFLTSGSTGDPKASIYTHKTLISADLIYREVLAITAQDRLITTLDMNGNAGFTLQILPLLNAGAQIALLTKRDGESAYKAIQDGATILCMIPWLGMALLDRAKDEPIPNSPLRYCLVGGDSIPDEIFESFPKLFGVSPNQVIGMTETNIYAMNLKDQQEKPHSAGRIVPHTQVHIVSQDGSALPVETIGEITVRTPMCFAGYWNQPEMTAQTFLNGFVKTGDLGYFDKDGCLFFAGRIKQIIIHCGMNIYPKEVELACAQHPKVKSAIAVGLPNAQVGEDIGIALNLWNPDDTLTLQELRDFLNDKLSDFKIPTHLKIFHPFPKNKAGKVDRKKLVASFLI
jgi:long-chain acyl-CoA synthetase